MKRYDLVLVMCCIMSGACGCHTGNQSSTPKTDGLRAKELVGKWRLVRADGKPPAELSVNSDEIEIAADGTWSSKIDLAGLTMKGGGKWSLADGTISYTNGAENGKSRVTLSAGRLVLEPDFHLRKNDATKAPITGEYER